MEQPDVKWRPACSVLGVEGLTQCRKAEQALFIE